MSCTFCGLQNYGIHWNFLTICKLWESPWRRTVSYKTRHDVTSATQRKTFVPIGTNDWIELRCNSSLKRAGCSDIVHLMNKSVKKYALCWKVRKRTRVCLRMIITIYQLRRNLCCSQCLPNACEGRTGPSQSDSQWLWLCDASIGPSLFCQYCFRWLFALQCLSKNKETSKWAMYISISVPVFSSVAFLAYCTGIATTVHVRRIRNRAHGHRACVSLCGGVPCHALHSWRCVSSTDCVLFLQPITAAWDSTNAYSVKNESCYSSTSVPGDLYIHWQFYSIS